MSSSTPRPEIHLRSPAQPSIEFSVRGPGFRNLAIGIGELRARFDPGIYEVEARAPGVARTTVVVLRPGEGYRDLDVRLDYPSVTPLRGTTTTQFSHRRQVRALSREPTRVGEGTAGLVLQVRALHNDAPLTLSDDLLAQLSVVQNGVALADFADGWRVGPSRTYAGWSSRMAPGGYAIRVSRPGASSPDVLDQTIWLAEGWQTLVFIPLSPAGPSPADASIHNLRLGTEWSELADRIPKALEAALEGLREGRAVLSPSILDELLHRKFENPMLGIVAAHSLLVEEPPDLERLSVVLGNLLRLVPGHPDVVALSVMAEAVGVAVDRAAVMPAAWPPMLVASLVGLTRASMDQPAVIPVGSMAETAVARRRNAGVWVAWSPPVLIEERITLTGGVAELVPAEKELATRDGEHDQPVATEQPPPPPPSASRRPAQIPKTLAQVAGGAARRRGWWDWASLSTPFDQLDDLGQRRIASYLDAVAATGANRLDRLLATDERQVAQATGLPVALVSRQMDQWQRTWAVDRATGTNLLLAILAAALATMAWLLGWLRINHDLPAKVTLGLLGGALGSLGRLGLTVGRVRARSRPIDGRLRAVVVPVQAAIGAVTGLVVAFVLYKWVHGVPGTSGRSSWVALSSYAAGAGVLATFFAPPASVAIEPQDRRDKPLPAPTTQQTGTGPVTSWKNPLLATAGLTLLIFLGFAVWTLTNRGDRNWDRIVYVFGSVEAIAFAAAGALFGTHVQRQQTDQAQLQAAHERTRADLAQGQVQEHATRAARGQALAAGVKAAAAADAGGPPAAGDRGLRPSSGAPSPVWSQLAAIADTVLADPDSGPAAGGGKAP